MTSEAKKETEASMLDRLWAKYGTVRSLGDAPRYLVAEHPRTPLGDRGNRRVLDCLILDRHTTNGLKVVPEEERYNSIIGCEIKVSRGDWLRELKDPSKSLAWAQYCTEFYVVAPRGVVKQEELPEGWGLMCPAGPTGALRASVKAPVVTPLPMPSTVLCGVVYAAMKTDRKRRPRG